MAKARRNESGFKIGKGVNLAPSEIEEGKSRFDAWHWGNKPTQVVDWNDPDMPNMLIECGKLVRLHLRIPQTGAKRHHPRRQKDTMIEFARNVSPNCHVAYDPDHPHERLYLLIDSSVLPSLKQRFWDDNNFAPMNLGALASVIGGTHGNPRDYPNIEVKPIGVCTSIVYWTNKKGDGPSFYIHQMAEISKVFPALACDESGRLWLAGANYSAPEPGITD